MTPELLNWWERHLTGKVLPDDVRAEYQRILSQQAALRGYVEVTDKVKVAMVPAGEWVIRSTT